MKVKSEQRNELDKECGDLGGSNADTVGSHLLRQYSKYGCAKIESIQLKVVRHSTVQNSIGFALELVSQTDIVP